MAFAIAISDAVPRRVATLEPHALKPDMRNFIRKRSPFERQVIRRRKTNRAKRHPLGIPFRTYSTRRSLLLKDQPIFVVLNSPALIGREPLTPHPTCNGMPPRRERMSDLV